MHRVLKPGGFQLYTVPLLYERRSRQRMRREGDAVVDLLPPSHHGLAGEYPVVWEFGGDFLRGRRRFLHRVFYDHFWRNPTVFAAVEGR